MDMRERLADSADRFTFNKAMLVVGCLAAIGVGVHVVENQEAHQPDCMTIYPVTWAACPLEDVLFD